MDTTRLGEVAAALMESLATQHDGGPVKLGAVMVLAEVDTDDWNAIAMRCSDDRVWIQRGLLRAALEQNLPREHEEDAE